jgi:hypothetical protein
VCGFDGGAAGVDAVGFVFWWVCGAGVGVVETVGKKKKKNNNCFYNIFNRIYCKIKSGMCKIKSEI